MLVIHGEWCLTSHEFEDVFRVVPRQERVQVGFGHRTQDATCAVEQWRDHQCGNGNATNLAPTEAGSPPARTGVRCGSKTMTMSTKGEPSDDDGQPDLLANNSASGELKTLSF